MKRKLKRKEELTAFFFQNVGLSLSWRRNISQWNFTRAPHRLAKEKKNYLFPSHTFKAAVLHNDR
jgi:hypothetical protein